MNSHAGMGRMGGFLWRKCTRMDSIEYTFECFTDTEEAVVFTSTSRGKCEEKVLEFTGRGPAARSVDSTSWVPKIRGKR